MDKLKMHMHMPNKAHEHFKKLAALFPNAVTETVDENGVVVRAIDKDVLMQKINTTVVEGKDERYQFTWPDKKKSVLLANNIKADRTPEDLLFQVMLDLGVLLSRKIEETKLGGKRVFNVADDFLIACFDTNVTEETITAIAKQKPYYFVMRDSSLANDSVATNFDQIFATYSPDTVRKVL
ncbi:hypothetical protein [Allofournierella massiliensis]|uniref:Uncharacterized protein n=1 Tax=Allofournierella massiliensis TaxID=1650663 RepID=A0ABT7UU65_9FIRM|nr:hypothetical protein [Fournierella massiliensis]MDM8202285.1 hypothetical protein [Fournierella massiliensis]